ncbi:DUF6519 domain-containing protein [Arthrobacter sp. ERGS1:01]|uniref:DUF6519 domain-containing protein n=1 Tax=Arthrobacter sp. ERGS1:01 TaxID=1704044 RepID=UPI0006B5F5BF|nr:DUF6519 domain-containing protein [Arthrobacter sp. ERGS1:01]
MKGDFSRDTFDPRNHYTRVLLQQGRVHLDADFNEQSAIAVHRQRLLALDVIGPEGGPRDNAGFAVITDPAVAKALGKKLVPGDFLIGAGRYYVNGAMCQNPTALLYSEQPGYPFDDATTTDSLADLPNYTIYLDVWERHINAVEDPGLLEPALGGPDTATRARLTWQVRVLPISLPDDGTGVAGQFARAVPLLAAQAEPPATNNDPCSVDPAARYRGLENQLYRVEIHASGLAGVPGTGATFKWSRDNGSVTMPLAGSPATDPVSNTTTITLATLGRDTDLGLVVGGWVELVDDNSTLRHAAAPLLRVHSVDRDDFSVVLEGLADPATGLDPRLHPYLRRWDHDGDPASGGAVTVVESAAAQPQWLDLEDGVQVYFPGSDGGAPGAYRTGDYWLIPARTATGDVEWPRDDGAADLNPQPLPPHGEDHAYAGLSGVGPSLDGTPGGVFTELRKFFAPLAM